MQRKSRRLVVFVLTVLIFGPSAAITQAKDRSLEWREFLRFTRMEAIPVGDVKGHIIGVWEMKGLAVFDNDEIAIMSSSGNMDSTNGIGSYQGYVLYTFEDKSTKMARLRGKVIKTFADKGNYQEGTISYIQGTGRFKGIKGEGFYTARQYLSTGSGGDTFIKVTATITLPSD